MNDKLSRWPAQYLAALRQHLQRGRQASSQSAIRVGRQAVALGLETLDVARIHERALAALVPPDGSSKSSAGKIQRAKLFFADAIAPIEQTHRPVQKTEFHLQQANQTLRQRTVESASSARHLKQGIRRRQAAAAALDRSGKRRTKLLAESRRLRQHSQHLTHTILSAQENEWRKISRQLHDEIAQILLGIHVRLLTLKKAARANTGSLKNEIASTQRLVKQSVRTINQFAREVGLHHET